MAGGRKTGEALILTPRPKGEMHTDHRLSRPFVALFIGWVLGAWLTWLLRETIPGWRAWRVTVPPVFRDAARWITPFLSQFTQDSKSSALYCYGAALLFLALLLYLWKRFGKKSVLLVIVLGTALGMGGAFRHMAVVQPVTPWLDREVRCDGRVGLNPRYGEEKDVYLFTVTDIYGEDGHAPLRVSLRLEIEGAGRLRYQPGDLLTIDGLWEAPPPASNPGGFDYRRMLMADGIGGILRAEPQAVTYRGTGSMPLRMINSARNWLSEVYDRYAGEGAGLSQAMILGERWRLPEDVYTGFKETGMAHLLAISGLHVGFLAACLWFLFRRLRLGEKGAFFCLLGILPLYAVLTGAGVSVLRATVMVLIVAGGRALKRRPDLLNSLCVAGLVILAFRPLDILDAGFQLSFCALLGIILVMPLFRRLFHFLPGGLNDLLSMSLAAQLGVAPVLAWHFHGIAPASLLANLLLIPLAGIFINLGFLLPLISWIPLVPVALGRILDLMARLMLWLNTMAASLLGYRSIPSPGWVFLIGYYLAMFFISGRRPTWARKRWRWGGGIALATAMILILTPVLDNRFVVVFADVGQGACVYVRTPDEKHFLMDAGGNIYGGDYDPGASRVAPFLLSNGVGQLDMMAVSHAHEDHIGGVPAVLDTVGADRFLYYPPGEPDASWPVIWEALGDSGIPVSPLAAGDTLSLGDDVRIRVLYPPAGGPASGEENDRSLCLLFRYGDASVLLTGDMEGPAESSVAHWPDVDIAQIPHHGSNTSSGQSWIEALSPCTAIAQAGINNPYHHPSPEVLDRYRDAGTAVFSNNQDGAVVCEYRRGRWTVYGVRGDGIFTEKEK